MYINTSSDIETLCVLDKDMLGIVAWSASVKVRKMPRQLTLDLGLPKIMHLIKPLGLINPNTASNVQGEQC